MELILASASPRRSQLLKEAGFDFRVEVPDVEEAHDASLSCAELTEANAALKAKAIALRYADACAIGADTLVYLRGEPLGKPRDMDEAREMLRRLSGQRHEVCTGVALAWDAGQKVQCFAIITEVEFHVLSEEVIAAYHAVVPVLDKAGGYAIQDHGQLLVKEIHGSHSNVVGLPMEALTQWLLELGFSANKL
jgi:septum formation protein